MDFLYPKSPDKLELPKSPDTVQDVGLLAKAAEYRNEKPQSLSKKNTEKVELPLLTDFFEQFAKVVKSDDIKKSAVVVKIEQHIFVVFTKGFFTQSIIKIHQVQASWKDFFVAHSVRCWVQFTKKDFPLISSIFPLNDFVDDTTINFFTFKIKTTECCFFFIASESSNKENLCSARFISKIIVQTRSILNAFSFPKMLSAYISENAAKINYAFSSGKNAYVFSLSCETFFEMLIQTISPVDAETILTILYYVLAELVGYNNSVSQTGHIFQIMLFSNEYCEVDLVQPLIKSELQKLFCSQYLDKIDYTHEIEYNQKDALLKMLAV